MLIEFLTKAKTPTGEPGSDIIMGRDTVYPFRPDEEGRHVCFVDHKAHLAQMLETGDFQPVGKAPKPAATDGDKPAKTEAEIEREALEARYEEVVGRKPHHRAHNDTLQAHIAAALAKQAKAPQE